MYKFITFTFLTKQSIIQKFKEVELQVLRFFDVFYLLQKVLCASFWKKTIKKILQKNRKIMKNLKCKMKKMTYPPISQTTLITTKSTFLMVWPAPNKQKLEMMNNFFCSTKNIMKLLASRESIWKKKNNIIKKKNETKLLKNQNMKNWKHGLRF